MPKKLPSRDPVGDYQRRTTAKRRVGSGKRCSFCGESRPEALISGSKPTICAECQRKQQDKSTTDAHHVAGKSNCNVTLAVPVNDHRAVLSPAQNDWPPKTLENPDGSPLLAGAGCIRGFVDTALYLVEKLLLWTADLLEALDAFLTEKLGKKWWHNTELEKFSPRR